jgi:hypothetical protein
LTCKIRARSLSQRPENEQQKSLNKAPAPELKTRVALEAIQVYRSCPAQGSEGAVGHLAPTEAHHHVLSVFCLLGTLLVSVKLFGQELLTCLYPLSVTSN